jgi:hypothetical protein
MPGSAERRSQGTLPTQGTARLPLEVRQQLLNGIYRGDPFSVVLFLLLTVRPYLISSDTSIEAALEPVKLVESIGKGCGEVGSRFAVQRFGLDQPGAHGGIPECPS